MLRGPTVTLQLRRYLAQPGSNGSALWRKGTGIKHHACAKQAVSHVNQRIRSTFCARRTKVPALDATSFSTSQCSPNCLVVSRR